MGISTGEVEARDDDYFGPALNHAERTMAAGHGGQILVTAATAGLVGDVELLDLGSHRLRGLVQTIRLYQVGGGDRAESLPRLNTEDVEPGNLPRSANALLGRDANSVEVRKLLTEARLLYQRSLVMTRKDGFLRSLGQRYSAGSA
jgi:hypothetical protein